MKNDEEQPSSFSTDHPLSSRETISRLIDEPGEIVSIDENNKGIKLHARNGVTLLPLNMPEGFQQIGMKVIISGETKRIDATELWAAQPFIVSNIKKPE